MVHTQRTAQPLCIWLLLLATPAGWVARGQCDVPLQCPVQDAPARIHADVQAVLTPEVRERQASFEPWQDAIPGAEIQNVVNPLDSK